MVWISLGHELRIGCPNIYAYDLSFFIVIITYFSVIIKLYCNSITQEYLNSVTLWGISGYWCKYMHTRKYYIQYSVTNERLVTSDTCSELSNNYFIFSIQIPFVWLKYSVCLLCYKICFRMKQVHLNQYGVLNYL